MYVDRSIKRIAAALLVLWIFFVYAPDFTESPAAIAGVLAVTVIVSGYVSHLIKHYFYKRLLLFDIHNVILEGDLNFEAFREMPGMRRLVGQLRDNYKVGALTNMSPDMFQFYSSKFGLGGMFDYVTYSGKIKVRKPDPAIYHAALAEANSGPRDAIFIDDLTENVEGAKRLGMDGIVFKNAEQLAHELRKRDISF